MAASRDYRRHTNLWNVDSRSFVYEKGSVPGGKAREAFRFPTAVQKDAWAGWQHGFRFFPRYYRNFARHHEAGFPTPKSRRDNLIQPTTAPGTRTDLGWNRCDARPVPALAGGFGGAAKPSKSAHRRAIERRDWAVALHVWRVFAKLRRPTACRTIGDQLAGTFLDADNQSYAYRTTGSRTVPKRWRQRSLLANAYVLGDIIAAACDKHDACMDRSLAPPF